MPTTDNGWDARRDLPLRDFVVNGVAFLPGIIDNDDVETILRYCMEQYAERIEPLRNPGCWGFAYRENRNDPNRLSRHSGGIAVDANAPAHPNGVATYKTFTTAQIAEIHQILSEVDFVIRWGGDYTSTPDAMHWEVNTDPATLHFVAERIRGEDMANYADQLNRIEAAQAELKVLAVEERKRDRASWKREAALAREVKRLGGDVDKVLAAAEKEED